MDSGTFAGEAFSQFVLVVGGGQMAGSITLPGAIYGIRHLDGKCMSSATSTGRWSLREAPPIPVDVPLEPVPYHPSGPADDGLTIHVMVVYTAAARSGAGGTTAMQNLIDLAVSQTNQSYANSGITQRLRLVNTAEVPYAESGSSIRLSRLQHPSDGYLDEVHVLRDRFGADCVSLLVERMNYYAGEATS